MDYQVVGRHTDGREVVGYQLQEIESGKSFKANKEQVAFLVGRGRITNCDGQLSKDQFILRGVGIKLSSLPTVNADGVLTKNGSVGHIRQDDTAEDIMNKLILVGRIMKGKSNLGYVVGNHGGATKNVTRDIVLKLAREGSIVNATVQNHQGKEILRGKGVKLTDLPEVIVDGYNNTEAEK